MSSRSWRNAKILGGLLGFYASTEAYLHIRTKQIVSQRKAEFEKAATLEKDEIDVSRFKSATIAGMFINPFEEYRPQTGFEFTLVRIMELFESFYGNRVEVHNPLQGSHTVGDYLQVYKPDLEELKKNSQAFNYNKLAFTWLGQSCALIQLSGINILTDPILSDHLITPHVGPKRLNKSPMNFEDIQYATNDQLDFIVVSHDHPDHLENDLIKKFGNNTTWIVPLGLKSTLARKGIFKVIEMDWWDTLKLNKHIDNAAIKDDYEIVCVPSMHWSGRYIVDANFSLWNSYIIKKNGKSVLYHAGDTGYLKALFDVIGKKYGPIQFAMLPIGQYCPSWHQKPRHISPEECLKICQQTQTKYMMGVHWGTFKLSSEPILEPKLLLTKLARDINQEKNYKAPEFGFTYVYDLD